MASGIRLVRSDLLAPADYAHLAEAPGSWRTLWLAGACPLDAEGRTVAPGDRAGQAHQVMRNLAAALSAAGASLADVVRTTVYVVGTDGRDLVTAWEVYREHMAGHDPPSTLLGVALLGYRDQLVEVDAVAVVPDPPPRG